MAGTKTGGAKAHQTKINKDPDFYRKIGKQSWKNERNRVVGFALLEPEERKALGAKGGSKTKKEYKKANTTTEVGEASTGIGE